MTDEKSQYEAIHEICGKSQEILVKGIQEGFPLYENIHANIQSLRPARPLPQKEARLLHGLMDFESHEPMWKKYSARTKGRVEFRHADFSRLFFIFARFKKHNFIIFPKPLPKAVVLER